MKTRIYCRAAIVDKPRAAKQLEVLTGKGGSFASVPGAVGPTVFFSIDIEIPDELMLHTRAAASITIDSDETHIIAAQARLPRLAESAEDSAVEVDE